MTEQASAAGSKGPARQAIAYTLLGALPRALGFLLLPVYTRALGPGQYGRMSVAMAVFSLAAFLMTAGLEVSVFRSWFSLKDEPERQRVFVQSAWRFLIGFPFGAALLLGAIALALGGTNVLDGPQIALALIAAAAQTASTTLPMAISRARENLSAYTRLSLATTVPTVLLTLLFVLALRWGVDGWIAAIAIGQGISLLFAFAIVPWERGVRWSWPSVRRGISFGLPTLPNMIAFWGMNLADRIVLAGLVSTGALGVYSFGANLAVPVMVGVMSLGQAMMPSFSRFAAGELDAGRLRQLMRGQAAAVALLAGGASLLAGPLVDLMAPSSFGEAVDVVGWIALGYGFLGLYYIPANCITLITGRNKAIWLAAGSGAIVNLGLLFAVVPSGGIRAAAIASAAGGAAMFAAGASYWTATKGATGLRMPWAGFVSTGAVAVAVWAAGQLLLPDSGIAGLVIRALWFAVLCAAVAATGAFGPIGEISGRLRGRRPAGSQRQSNPS